MSNKIQVFNVYPFLSIFNVYPFISCHGLFLLHPLPLKIETTDPTSASARHATPFSIPSFLQTIRSSNRC
ncbi:hypothetical protein RIF29_35623 [Crotalaria pallida]|uniref:Uncharacterized protein n=1 Tax=Crotalaria pallida TaxID=3830 RepID=A0AAN9HV95_CROPI